MSAEREEELRLRRARDDLIGRIEAMCGALREDPPFGLRAASLEALQKMHARLRERGAGRA